MVRLYEYVGAAEIRLQANAEIERLQPRSLADIRCWAETHSLELTFVVDAGGALWLSDRRSEHVACARGRPVLAAGELFLSITPTKVVVARVTNQSTGYCPEPGSWPAVRDALRAAGLEPPEAFSHEFHFRRCTACSVINLLKPEMPECGACGADLPEEWNFAERE